MSDTSPEIGAEVARLSDTPPPSFKDADLELLKRIGASFSGEGFKFGITELPKDDSTPVGETRVIFALDPADAELVLDGVERVFRHRDDKLAGQPPELAARALGAEIDQAVREASVKKIARPHLEAHAQMAAALPARLARFSQVRKEVAKMFGKPDR